MRIKRKLKLVPINEALCPKLEKGTLNPLYLLFHVAN